MTTKQKKLLVELGVNVEGLTISSKEAYELIRVAYQERKESSRSIADEARQADLYELADDKVVWYRDKDNYATGKCPMSGCSSTEDAFFVMKRENVGGCRKCEWHLNGNGSGAIGYMMALESVDWHEAARLIVNRDDRSNALIQNEIARQKETREKEFKKFQKVWSRRLYYGQGALLHSGAMNYLRQRGITYETATAFGVGANRYGYGPYRGEQCALFPYFGPDGKLCAVNRRVARDVEHDKCWFASGSRKEGFFGLSGWSGLTWVIEGEINAMSVWQLLQLMGRSDAVLSLSSEYDMTTRAKEIADRFDSVIAWCDDKKVRDTIRQEGVMAWATKHDANDLLLSGRLEVCIKWMLERGTW